jgi:hypothetical protein
MKELEFEHPSQPALTGLRHMNCKIAGSQILGLMYTSVTIINNYKISI